MLYNRGMVIVGFNTVVGVISASKFWILVAVVRKGSLMYSKSVNERFSVLTENNQRIYAHFPRAAKFLIKSSTLGMFGSVKLVNLLVALLCGGASAVNLFRLTTLDFAN